MKDLLSRIWNNKIFAQIFRTKIGLLFFSLIWKSVWLSVYYKVEGEWPLWVAAPAALYTAVLVLIMFAYAWVINPIRDLKEKKKRRKNQ